MSDDTLVVFAISDWLDFNGVLELVGLSSQIASSKCIEGTGLLELASVDSKQILS